MNDVDKGILAGHYEKDKDEGDEDEGYRARSILLHLHENFVRQLPACGDPCGSRWNHTAEEYFYIAIYGHP